MRQSILINSLRRVGILLAAITLSGVLHVALAVDFAPTAKAAPTDFDGDGKSDLAFFNPLTGEWLVQQSSDGMRYFVFHGEAADQPVAADYDADRITDLAVVHNKAGQLIWQIRPSGAGGAKALEIQWGMFGDVPVQGDYDGDGITDIAIYRPKEGSWHILPSATDSNIVIQFGIQTDRPVPGDYDGDNRADIAIYRPSERVFYILNSATGTLTIRDWRARSTNPQEDMLVPADYDGDGRTDLAVFSAQDGLWLILESSTGEYRAQVIGGNTVCTGESGNDPCVMVDFALPGDFDGDGKTDPAVWVSNAARVHVIGSLHGAMKFTTATTAEMRPVSSSYMIK